MPGNSHGSSIMQVGIIIALLREDTQASNDDVVTDPVSGRAGTQTQACLTLRQTGGPPATSGLQMGFFLASTVGFCCFFVFSPN